MCRNIYTEILNSIQNGKKVCMVSNILGEEGKIGTDLRRQLVLDSNSDLFIRESLEEGIPQFLNKETSI